MRLNIKRILLIIVLVQIILIFLNHSIHKNWHVLPSASLASTPDSQYAEQYLKLYPNSSNSSRLAQSSDKQSDAEFLQELEKISNDTGQGVLLFSLNDEKLVFILEDSTDVLTIDLKDDDLFEELYEMLDSAVLSRQDALQVSRQLTGLGVQQRLAGNYSKAHYFYRFPIICASYFQDIQGIDVLTSNIWYLHKTLEIAAQGRVLPFSLALSEEEESRQEYIEQELDLVQETLLKDFELLFSRLNETDINSSLSRNQKLIFFLAMRRISSLKKYPKRAEYYIKQIAELAETDNEKLFLLEASVEYICEMTTFDILTDIYRIEDVNFTSNFLDVWKFYVDSRKLLDITNPEQFARILVLARDNLKLIRSNGVISGGQFGHRVSFQMSQFLQPIGRDLVFLLNKAQNVDQALSVAEDLRSRALTDWMGRSHVSSRLAFNPQMSGNVSEVYPASYNEILATPQRIDAPILLYFRDQFGYSVWYVDKDGELLFKRLEDFETTLSEALSKLPYLDGDRGFSEVGDIRGRGFEIDYDDVSTAELKSYLNDLYNILIPSEIKEKITDSGTSKIAIVTDSILDSVPFSALVLDDGRYLIESLEVFYLPSITAQLLVEEDLEHQTLISGNFYEPNNDFIVVGNPIFSNPYRINTPDNELTEINLSSLPGTEREAKVVSELLAVEPLIGENANLAMISEKLRRYPKSKLLHLATHGVLVNDRPEASFIALTGEQINVDYLYNYDPGLPVQMVVLSACQTALGFPHPDSSIGLTNAFFVAGANTVISTLWQIPDIPTSEMISDFYAELVKGNDIASSLRHAQLKMINDEHWQYPSYWASFKVIGNTKNIF